MIHNRQKMLLHIYKDAARLTDPYYRELLLRHAGCRSAAARSFPQRGFDLAMAALETVLFDRVEQGLVQDPVGRSRYVSATHYWRNRLNESGLINTRQIHHIKALWNQLAPVLGFPDPESPDALAYVLRIIRKSTGRTTIGFEALSLEEASYLIDALKDRLAYSPRRETVA